MEVEIHNSKEDYRQFLRYYHTKKNLFDFVLIILIPGFLAIPLSATSKDFSSVYAIVFCVLAIFLVFILKIGPYIAGIQDLKGTEAEKYFLLSPIKISIGEHGLRVEETGSDEKFLSFRGIKRIGIDEHFIFIYSLSGRLLLLPTRFFISKSYYDNFYLAIQNQRRKDPLDSAYWWSLLCVVPLIGAVAGLVFIIKGIFQLRDTRLAIIGFSGIVFTFGVYYNLFEEMKNGEASGIGFASIAQSQLNSISKEVEFYKSQNGVYPDSLRQLNANEPYVSIYDPLLGRKMTKGNVEYHYQKLGSKYTLFSVGVDGIPNTSDDIYPNLAIKDTSKYGLIRSSRR